MTTPDPSDAARRLHELEARCRAQALLLEQAQAALASCRVYYSEFNQFEGEWHHEFDESLVGPAQCRLNAALGLPAPVPLRTP